jgi:glycosyltransferase involved in cell wall biosynthesis
VTRRILYLQYTNPAAYPPLQHSALMLAERGWDVLFVGIAGAGAAGLAMPRHDRITNKQAGDTSGGPLGPLKYAMFAWRSLVSAVRFRPHWCYASDPFSAPVARAIRRATGARIVYHEHDAPVGESVNSTVMTARAVLAATADVVIAPSAARLELLPDGSGQRFVVWNCPRRAEAAGVLPANAGHEFGLVYHGSLSRDRLTPEFVDALRILPPHVHLHIYGYETAGHRGYAAELRQRAEAAGLHDRVHYHGTVAERAALLDRLRRHQLGIATIAAGAADQNLHTLAGASNKAFEYLALGLPLLISREPTWQQLYQIPGYAVDCVPTDAASIAAAVQPLCSDPSRAQQMGAAGRERVRSEWNYEAQFAPVLDVLSA